MDIQKDLYVVERIVARKKTQSGSFLYKIKWKGYPSYQSTWEPLEHLGFVRSLVRRYDENYSRMQSRRRRTRNRAAQLKTNQRYLRNSIKLSHHDGFAIKKGSAKLTQQILKKQIELNHSKKARVKRIGKLAKLTKKKTDGQHVFFNEKKGLLIQSQKHSTSIEQNGEISLGKPKTKRKPRKKKQTLLRQTRLQFKLLNKNEKLIKNKFKRITKESKKQKNDDHEQSFDSHSNSVNQELKGCQTKLEKKQNIKQVVGTVKKLRKDSSSWEAGGQDQESEEQRAGSTWVKDVKWFEILQDLLEKQQKLSGKVNRKADSIYKNEANETQQKQILPFIITLNQLQGRSHIPEYLPRRTSSKTKILSKSKLPKRERRNRSKNQSSLGAPEHDAKQKRNRKKRSFAEIFISNKLPSRHLIEENRAEKYSKSQRYHSEQCCDSGDQEQSQRPTLYKQIEKYEKEREVELRVGKEGGLNIILKNEEEVDCEFDAREFRTFCGEWLKSFYQQYI